MKRETLISAAFFVIMISPSIIVAYPLFADGLPMGIDSTSHLFKVLYLDKAFRAYGHIPAWCTDWYGGTPFLHFYPPLAYLLTFSISLIGLGPVLAYKIIDALFYIATPLFIFLLSRTLGFNKIQSFFSGLLFSLTPIVLENFLFYDRFTSVVSPPLLCLFLVTFIKALDLGRDRFFIISSLLMTSIILVHHLTAYYVGLIILFLAFSHYLKTRDVKAILKGLFFVIVIPLLLSAFWFFPFVNSVSLIDNPFYNRSNVENFLSLEGLTSVIVPFGIQFVLSIMEITFRMFPSREDVAKPRSIFKFLFPSCAIVFGSIVSIWILELGRVLVVLGFIAFLTFFLEHMKKEILRERNYIFCVVWLISFLWFGLGFYGLLFRILPFSRHLDVLRFPFYLSIPQSILAGKFVDRLITSLSTNKQHFMKPNVKENLRPLLLLSLLISILAASFLITKDVTYRGNASIPSDVVDFFKSKSEEGRILPIKCPHWIYVLPYYTGKPIIDGWYPQEKLLKPLLEIDDYQINTLNLYEEGEQIRKWSNLIGNSSRLGLKWVIIGKPELVSIMDKYPYYTEILRVGNITIYESMNNISFAEVDRWDSIDRISFLRISTDHISIHAENVRERVNVIVKEANFQGWKIEIDNVPVEHSQTGDGFISFYLDPGSEHRVEITYERQGTEYFCFSLIGLSLIILPYVSKKIRQ